MKILSVARLLDSRSDEEADSLLSDGIQTIEQRKKRGVIHIFYLLAIFFTNLITAVCIANLYKPYASQRWISGSPSTSLDRPLYAEIDEDSVHRVNFSAISFRPSPYTAPPSKEVDQAWTDLGVEC